MSFYRDLEDSLYNVVNGLNPTWNVIFAFTNGPEPASPYLVIDVKQMNPIGREYLSTPTELPVGETVLKSVALQDHEAFICFDFIGKYDDQTTLGEMASTLQVQLRTQQGYELQSLNRLSLFGISNLRRTALKRETDMYMVYRLECRMAYTSYTESDVDNIEIIGIDGVYYDAGREPDHIIHTHLDIP